MKPLREGVLHSMFAACFWNRLACVVSIMLVPSGLPFVANAASSAQDAALWKALSSGEHIALLRHAIAPGIGDPENFVLSECSTQRNLSPAGRDQAARIGKRLRENGITHARVYVSQWCRALETAKLLQLGPVSELPALNSFFGSQDRGEAQTRTLTQWLAKQDLARPLLLVTHQVNVTALTGVYPGSGEMVIVRRTTEGNLRVVGTIKTE